MVLAASAHASCHELARDGVTGEDQPCGRKADGASDNESREHGTVGLRRMRGLLIGMLTAFRNGLQTVRDVVDIITNLMANPSGEVLSIAPRGMRGLGRKRRLSLCLNLGHDLAPIYR